MSSEELNPFIENLFSFLIYILQTIKENIFLLLELALKDKDKTYNFYFSFDNAQKNALIFLTTLFIINCTSILFIWKFHGEKVFKRFKKPTPPKVFEELNRSVSNLKLPKVYSPRI
ncbi:unnamed protein product [Nezara viridula]|uniref:Uncharacterized protein n=1 Tax=Nezara viridula TaxID=85310 RepID=A0A9P0EAP5_NEZVI|nr:unnamed protein product [Nezara viridula]